MPTSKFPVQDCFQHGSFDEKCIGTYVFLMQIFPTVLNDEPVPL